MLVQRMVLGLAAAAFLFLTPLWAPASACSMNLDYVRPSNFELVQMSDAIVVATALEERPGDNRSTVTFEIGEKLKGEAPPEVEIVGRIEPEPVAFSAGSGPRVIIAYDACEP